MTFIRDGKVILAKENPQQCDFCGNIAELRPYGPKGECICYTCAMKPEYKKTTLMQFTKLVLGLREL